MDLYWRPMAARNLLLCFLLITFCGASFASATTLVTKMAQPETMLNANASPEQQLSQCLQIAKQGKVKEAFQQAKRLHATFRSQRLFDVSYVNTLLSIVEENETELQNVILNETIGLVNQVRSTKRYDGIQDPEIAFHFMKALGRLSRITLPINERVSSKVRLYEGRIALNLSKNPSYPKNAVEALSLPLFSMAQGYAIRGNQKASFAALKLAVDNGFGDFDMIINDKMLSRLNDEAAMKKLIVDLRSRYKIAVDKWAVAVLANFQGSQLYFDLPEINGRRISNANFNGKVLVLDMWATWCPPCRKGIPHYIELQKNYRDRNVKVLGVSMDNPKDPASSLELVQEFVADQKFNYDCVMGDMNFASQIPGKQVLPTTIFFDPSGNVRYIARGYHDYAKVEAITKILASESQTVGTTIIQPGLSQ